MDAKGSCVGAVGVKYLVHLYVFFHDYYNDENNHHYYHLYNFKDIYLNSICNAI